MHVTEQTSEWGWGGGNLEAIHSSYHKLQLLLFINLHTQQEAENVQCLRTTMNGSIILIQPKCY